MGRDVVFLFVTPPWRFQALFKDLTRRSGGVEIVFKIRNALYALTIEKVLRRSKCQNFREKVLHIF